MMCDWRRWPAACVLAVLIVLTGFSCRDLEVVTESYATLQEAVAAGAVERGWLPRGLPPGSREIREAHDLDSNRRWGLFNFPQGESDALRTNFGPEMSLAGERCNPPLRIEWWPPVLRRELDQEQITATGLKGYPQRNGDLIFAVNWSQGRAYYWTRE